MAETIKGTFSSDVMPCSLVQIYWGLEELTTCTLIMKPEGSPGIAVNFYHTVQCQTPDKQIFQFATCIAAKQDNMFCKINNSTQQNIH
jgi:hypothetical protein